MPAKIPINKTENIKRKFVNDWICPECNVLIFGSKSQCNKCKTPNPTPRKFIASSADVNANRKFNSDWICPICTEMIFDSKKECKKCKTQNPNNEFYEQSEYRTCETYNEWVSSRYPCKKFYKPTTL